MNIYIDFEPFKITPLCDIMRNSGSDKGGYLNGQHNYTTYYYKLFENVRHEQLNIFELGLGTNNITLPSNMGINGVPGASLRGWKMFFKNSKIYGADIDRDILFQDDNIQTFYCDQTSEYEIKNMWKNPFLFSTQFDVIVEDGLHNFEANICFLKNSIHKLNINGVYIIEDIRKCDLNRFEELLPLLKEEYKNLIFRLLTIPYSNNYDNTLLIIQRVS